MKSANTFLALATSLLLVALSSSAGAARRPTPTPTPPGPTPPPAPRLVAPAAGSSLVQPIVVDWNAVVAPGGPIGSYTWQVGTTSAFTTIIASGFRNMDSDTTVPTPTQDKVSGLPNGTYFWRVKATQLTGGTTGSVDSTWSVVRSFTVTGPGAAPATPSFITPANNAQFHPVEFYDIKWTAVAGAQYYVLEADDEPTFAYPLTLSQSPITFGTQFGGGWGNVLTAYYRVRAVSADGVRGLPSAPLTVKITDTAPIALAVSQLAPAPGATVATPFFIDWSDTANPQVPGYEVSFNTNSTFTGLDVLSLPGVTRSDYMISADLLAPGSYFWRVRPLQGTVAGAWSPARAVKVTAGPTPPDVNLFAIIAEPTNAYGGNSVQARVLLDNPAPAGGAVVTLATDLPQAQFPTTTITIPAGKTDAMVSPIATGPVPNNGLSIGIIGDLFAGFSHGRQQSGLGVLPIQPGVGLSLHSAVGGTSFPGTITLATAAPAGGVTVRLVSGDTSLVGLPATVFIPAGGTDANFTVTTSAVAVSTRVPIDSGTDIDGYRSPQESILVTPPGTPASASLSSLTLSQSSILASGTVTATVTLTAPAPAGGAVVTVRASSEGQVIAPATVTVPEGSLSASFSTFPAPETIVPTWTLIQAQYGTSGDSLSRILEVDPAPGAPILLAVGPSGQDVIGGNPGRASVALVLPAPAGGGVVSLSTDKPSLIQVPATVNIPEGNSAVSFTIGTSPVSGLPTGGNIFATAGGVTKSIFITIAPNPNAAPLLQSVTISPASVPGGTGATGTVVLSAAAPAGGVTVTLATSAFGIANAPGVVTVPAGQTAATFSVTTFPVTADTPVTITALYDVSQKASLLVTKNATAPATLSSVTLSPATVTGGATSQATVALSSAAPSSGAVVTLSNSNTAAATLPASVTIAAGKTSGTVTVTSKTVTTSSSATITGTYNSVSGTAILTVNAGSGGGTLPAPSLLSPAADARFAPGTSITFDWTDVPGAASYSIQIDDSDTFPAPYLVDQTVTTSQYSNNTLPTKTMWFRTRANDASGTPGSWSATRRFEVKI